MAQPQVFLSYQVEAIIEAEKGEREKGQETERQCPGCFRIPNCSVLCNLLLYKHKASANSGVHLPSLLAFPLAADSTGCMEHGTTLVPQQ